MHVGVCRLSLRIPTSQSLKGKRHVSKSIISTIRSKYNVAVAEVDDNQRWQMLTLGISCVSNNRRHANEVLSRVVAFVEASRLDLEVIDYELEIVSGV